MVKIQQQNDHKTKTAFPVQNYFIPGYIHVD